MIVRWFFYGVAGLIFFVDLFGTSRPDFSNSSIILLLCLGFAWNSYQNERITKKLNELKG